MCSRASPRGCEAGCEDHLLGHAAHPLGGDARAHRRRQVPPQARRRHQLGRHQAHDAARHRRAVRPLGPRLLPRKEGADISLLDDCSDSALHWAAYKGNLHTAALLHYLGLPADAADSYGSTPLHLAAARGTHRTSSSTLLMSRRPRSSSSSLQRTIKAGRRSTSRASAPTRGPSAYYSARFRISASA